MHPIEEQINKSIMATTPAPSHEESVSGGEFIDGRLIDGELTLNTYFKQSVSRIHPIPGSYGPTDLKKTFTQVFGAERCEKLKNYISQRYSAEQSRVHNEIKGRIDDPSGKGASDEFVIEWLETTELWFWVEVGMKVNGKDAIVRPSEEHGAQFKKGLEIVLSDLDKLTLVKGKEAWVGLWDYKEINGNYGEPFKVLYEIWVEDQTREGQRVSASTST